MAEREEPQDGTEDVEPQESEALAPGAPLDEEAAWAQIVAGYGEEPEVGEGGWPDEADAPAGESPAADDTPPVNNGIPVIPRAFVIKAPTPGPRDYEAPDDGDEGHFVPPEPPPLPETDVTTKFAWLAVLGGPALMLAYVLFQEPPPWWAVVVGVGGFLGGFVTLVSRMRDPDEDEEDPHGGAVV